MTFCATANAIVHAGCVPVFADCDPRTFNIDVADVRRKITPRTRAIVPVHFAGRPCDIAALGSLAREHGLALVEDAAHALEATVDGRHCGTFGDFGCFSFYVTKSVTTADGGLLVARDPRLADRLRRLTLHGMSADAWQPLRRRRVRALRGRRAGLQVQPHRLRRGARAAPARRASTSAGSAAGPSGSTTKNELAGLPLRLPAPPAEGTRHALHLFTCLVDDSRTSVARDEVLAGLRALRIGAGIHYQAVHLHPWYRRTPRRAHRDAAGRRMGERADLLAAAVGRACPTATWRTSRAPCASSFHDHRGARPRSGPAPDLSLVVPCYNEARHLRASVRSVVEVLEQTGWTWDIVFVDDRSEDDTARADSRHLRGRPALPRRVPRPQPRPRRRVQDRVRRQRGACHRLPRHRPRGARGHIPGLVAEIERHGTDIATGRRHYLLRQTGGLHRAAASWGYRRLSNFLLGLDLEDSETGCKFFRRETAGPIVLAQRERRLVLGHGGDGARPSGRPAHRGGARAVPAARRQEQHRAVLARFVALPARAARFSRRGRHLAAHQIAHLLDRPRLQPGDAAALRRRIRTRRRGGRRAHRRRRQRRGGLLRDGAAASRLLARPRAAAIWGSTSTATS